MSWNDRYQTVTSGHPQKWRSKVQERSLFMLLYSSFQYFDFFSGHILFFMNYYKNDKNADKNILNHPSQLFQFRELCRRGPVCLWPTSSNLIQMALFPPHCDFPWRPPRLDLSPCFEMLFFIQIIWGGGQFKSINAYLKFSLGKITASTIIWTTAMVLPSPLKLSCWEFVLSLEKIERLPSKATT